METAKKSSAPLKTSNWNARASDARGEYLNRLISELKILMKKQAEEGKRSSEVLGGHENLDPDSDCRPVSDCRSVQTVIRPQVTNPKIFWSKSEDEDFCVDVRYKGGRCPLVSETINTNMFKPIRSDISPEPSNSGHRKMEDPDGSGKSIHESLRIQKVKRRTSLPYMKDEPPFEEPPQEFERLRTYDVSYYSSIMKRRAQESSAADFYAMSRKKAIDQGLMKAASDECIYGERQPEARYSNVKVFQRPRRSERLSVTEPSSPLSDHSVDGRRTGRSDSDMDSEGSTSDGPPVIVEMKKSKSFVDDKNADGYFKSKNYSKKSSTLEIRKPCYSSGSSCESSAYRTRSLRRTKPKRRSTKESFSGSYPAPQGYLLCHVKQGQHWVEARPEREMRRRPGFDNVSRERSQSWNRERVAGPGVSGDGRQKMNADVFQYLLNVLMQKNRAEPLPDNRQETFSTKSLPRNRSRRSREMSYDQDYWRGAPGPSSRGGGGGGGGGPQPVFVDYSWARNQRRRSEARKNTSTDSDSANQHEPSSHERESYRSRRKPDDVCGKTVLRLTVNPRPMPMTMPEPAPAPAPAPIRYKPDTPSKRLPLNSNRTIIESGADGKEERIFSIEDENLWIELCKAMGKVNEKKANAKKG